MHKLVEYICDELEELERKADKDGKLSMAEVQYMDLLAHTKKNLLKGEEMMEESEYSMDGGSSYGRGDSSYRRGGSMNNTGSNYSRARGRGRNARRDSRGRYSSMNDGTGGSSYADEMRDMVDSIYDIMEELPESAKHDAQKFVKKLEQTI